MKSVNYRIVIQVDNATIHTKAVSDVSMFGKTSGTVCSVSNLKWLEWNGNGKIAICRLQFFFLKS